MHRAVHFDDALGRVTGTLMQPVDVLRDQRVQFPAALELDQRQMSVVRLRAPGWMLQAALPREPANFRIGHVVVNVGKFFRFRIFRPQPLWAAEIRNSGLGRNAGARQRNHAGTVIDPPTNRLDTFGHRASLNWPSR